MTKRYRPEIPQIPSSVRRQVGALFASIRFARWCYGLCIPRTSSRFPGHGRTGLLAGPAFAQQGQINGVISDSSGGVIPGATVTATGDCQWRQALGHATAATEGRLDTSAIAGQH